MDRCLGLSLRSFLVHAAIPESFGHADGSTASQASGTELEMLGTAK